MAPEFSNAPLCTIDIAALKGTRFLLPDTRQLAYRDAAGRINSHLLLDCAKQVKRGAVTVGEDVRTKLDKWVRHAKWWEKEQGVSWERSPTGVWVSSAGERLEETREAALMRQRTEELEPKAASRVDDAVRKERRRALETLRLQKAQGGSEPAAGGGGGKREPAGGGGGKREPEADGGGGGKRERAAAEGGSSEARSKRSCPQSASEAEAESEAESEADSDAEAEAGLDKVIGKCEGVATRIREKFKPLLEEDGAGGPGGQGDSLRQPPLMSSELAMKPHQLIGLSWLHGLHQHGTGGILADEMGLGKTVQTISLLAQLLGEGDEGPHLVVAPVATLENWMREFAMWCPALRVVKFHGDEATKAAVRSSFSRRSDEEPPHVVVCGVTAFSGSSERARQEQAFLQRKLGRVGARGKLSYLVVDEAQKLKNDKSNVHQNVSKVEACHRLLLTGTPVENNPAELLTLLSFVAPRLFTASGKGSRASLSALFSSVGKGDGVACAPKVAKVQQLMRPFVLRRLKQEVLSALPPKTEEVAVVRMPPAQGAAYSETVARIAAQQRETLERWARRKAADRAELDAGCEEEVDGRDRGWIASAFTDLRKAAQHPLLLLRHYRPLLPRIAHALHCEGAFGDECTSEMVLSELETWSDIQVHLNCKAYSALRSLCLPSASLLGSAKAQKLASLLPPLVEEGHRALIFSQWTQTLDVLEELLHSLGIAYRRMDGAVSPQERQTIVDDFTADVSISCLLLSTRACGLGINLTSADTVILHDVDFNPAVDQQAMDRVHRIGQTRPVRVITLATEGTVDEKVLAIASKKVLSQHTLLGEGGAQADGARDSHAGLMGSILREVLLSRSSEGHHPGETRGGETRGGEPDGGEAAAVGEASAMEVEAEGVSQGEAVSQAEAGQGGECGAAGDVAGGEAEASGGGGGAAVSEETLRRLICERLAACEAEEEVSVKAVLRELSSRLGVDLKAAGLKPLVLQILGEEAR